MSLSDVHNPKAAAELIERFRRRFSTKVCMAPMLDHEPPIVSAHTLSVEAMLRKIAVGGHVYAPGSQGESQATPFPLKFSARVFAMFLSSMASARNMTENFSPALRRSHFASLGSSSSCWLTEPRLGSAI